MLTLYGRLIDFSCRPASDSGETFVVRDTPGGALSIAADGRIKWIGTQASLPPSFRDDRVVDHGDCWILPGFVDAHLHFPQYRMLAAHGADLLGWLQRFTFPEEVRFQDPAICERAAERFLDHLVTNGITSCLAFSSSHSCSVDAIFESAFRRNMALATGNVLMNRGAPKELLQTPEDSYDDSRQLINRWNGRGRLRYAVSPRFAMTSTEAQLEVAGQLVRENPKNSSVREPK